MECLHIYFMKKLLIAFLTLVSGALLIATSADAARLGSGRSFGMQRSITPAPAPARQAAPAAAPVQPAAAPASGLSRWLPALGGLAIGGLLGSMLGGLGGGAMGSILMMALLGIAVVFALKYFMRPRAPQSAPMQLAGMGATGNESARMPIEIGSAIPGGQGGYSAPVTSGPNIPAGFDVEGFVRAAKRNFMKLQLANDAGDLEAIRELATPEMYEELKRDVQARAAKSQTTDVVTVDADLADLATEGGKHYASVRFSGYVREQLGAAPAPFAEVWHLVKPVDGSEGWLLAGIQQEPQA